LTISRPNSFIVVFATRRAIYKVQTQKSQFSGIQQRKTKWRPVLAETVSCNRDCVAMVINKQA
jgi:hypothetical protein